jgi:hypothetical protein
MEQDEGFPIARGANIEAVYKALTQAGIVFIDENGGGVGVRLRKSGATPAPTPVNRSKYAARSKSRKKNAAASKRTRPK